MKGGGYYFDLRAPNIGGRPVYSGYDDFAPPIFVGELVKDQYSLGVGNIPEKTIGGKRRKRRSSKKVNRRRRSGRRI